MQFYFRVPVFFPENNNCKRIKSYAVHTKYENKNLSHLVFLDTKLTPEVTNTVFCYYFKNSTLVEKTFN